MKDKKATRAVSGARRRDEGSTKARAAGQYEKSNAGRLLAWAAIGFACIAAPISWATPGISQERLVSLMPGKRTAIIQIPMGKTQDVRVDGPFTDVTIGDPEVADVTPLTDHLLSILGKKIGTTRVSVMTKGSIRSAFSTSKYHTTSRALPLSSTASLAVASGSVP